MLPLKECREADITDSGSEIWPESLIGKGLFDKYRIFFDKINQVVVE
jgi:hypothetical protein